MHCIFYKKMLFQYLFFIFFVFSFSIPMQTFASNTPKILRVSYHDDTGFIACDSKGVYSGYGYDCLQEITNDTGWRYKKDNQTIFYEDFPAFDGFKIGLIQNSIQNKPLVSYAQAHHFTDQDLPYPSVTKAKLAFAFREADALMTGSLRRVIDEKMVVNFSPALFYFITAKGNDSLISSFNNTLKELQTTNIPLTATKFNATASSSPVAVLDCSSWLKSYAKILYPTAIVQAYSDAESCINAVKQHKADFVIENEYILYQYRKHFLYTRWEPIRITYTDFPLSVGISSHNSPVLSAVLNKTMIQLDPDKINDSILKHTMGSSQTPFFSIVQTFSPPVLGVVLCLLLFIIWRYQKKIEQYAYIDPLTGKWNQTKFILSANKTLRSKGYVGYATVSLDIDNFKLINTMHSFDTGNLILCALSDVIAEELHSSELFCRSSNDNFVLLLAYQEKEELTIRLEKLLEHIIAIPRTLKIDYQYTISCGIYLFTALDNDIHRAIGWASLARKTMKAHHQNRIAYYDDSMRKKATKQQEIENRMESAIQNEEFSVYYQPKYRLHDECLVGAEALVRWIPKDGDMIYPDEFIPLFESNGFIVKLDLYVFEQVCKQLRTWLNAGLVPCPISVNLSRVHLNQTQFYHHYLDIMRQYQIPTYLIELELTESTLFENKDQMAALLFHLKNSGITISMDDFGTGYSSLNLLKDMPIDILKLDREFFNMTSDTERGKKIIQSIVYMAQQLEITVVAEGVETIEQVKFLKSIQCDIVQGYYYSKPIPVQSFEQYLLQSHSI